MVFVLIADIQLIVAKVAADGDGVFTVRPDEIRGRRNAVFKVPVVDESAA